MTLLKSEKVEKKIKEKFYKKKNNLMRKANKLAELCRTDVDVLLARENRHYVYKSKKEQSWLPAAEIIVRYSIFGDIFILKYNTAT